MGFEKGLSFKNYQFSVAPVQTSSCSMDFIAAFVAKKVWLKISNGTKILILDCFCYIYFRCHSLAKERSFANMRPLMKDRSPLSFGSISYVESKF